MNEGMTNAEFNAFLETLAQLVESKAKTPAESAEIIPLLRMKKHFCQQGYKACILLQKEF